MGTSTASPARVCRLRWETPGPSTPHNDPLCRSLCSGRDDSARVGNGGRVARLHTCDLQKTWRVGHIKVESLTRIAFDRWD